MDRRQRLARGSYLLGLALALTFSAMSVSGRAGIVETGFDWPKYEHDNSGSGFTTDPGITAQNATTLALRPAWPVRSATGTRVTTQPIVSGGVVYWGSWDGVEHATPVNGGAGGWSRSLGTLTYPSTTTCSNSGVHGVGDAGVVQSGLTVKGISAPILFIAGGGNDSVGGGWASIYALNAETGAILWQTRIATSPDDYLWSSPVFHQSNGQTDPSVYEGVADVGEPCPLVRGEVVQLDALTGQVQNTFYTAPANCIGATIWGSLTVDANAVYAVTGNRGPCNALSEPYAFAIIKLDASTLTVVHTIDTWKVPKAELVNPDDDFGSVPILFSGQINGQTEPLIGAPNKNGIFYIWNRNDLAAGPAYRLTVANPNAADIAPAAFDGTTLYIGTTATTSANGVRQPGSVRAFNVNSLPQQAWQTALIAPVLASVTAAPGIVIVGAGHRIYILNATSGSIITTLQAEVVGATRGKFWSAPTIANGVLYEGDTNGFLYAYSPGGQ